MKLKYLRGKNGIILKSIMDVIIPPGGPFKAGASDYDLVPRIEEILKSYNPAVRNYFHLLLKYIQLSSIVHTGRTFTRLSAEKAERFLQKMESSPLYYRRMILLVIKLVVMLAFYDRDDVAEQIGYIHGCHLELHETVKRQKQVFL